MSIWTVYTGISGLFLKYERADMKLGEGGRIGDGSGRAGVGKEDEYDQISLFGCMKLSKN